MNGVISKLWHFWKPFLQFKFDRTKYRKLETFGNLLCSFGLILPNFNALKFQNYVSIENPNCIFLLIFQIYKSIGYLNYSLGLVLHKWQYYGTIKNVSCSLGMIIRKFKIKKLLKEKVAYNSWYFKITNLLESLNCMSGLLCSNYKLTAPPAELLINAYCQTGKKIHPLSD